MERNKARWVLQDLLGVLVALGVLLLMMIAIAIGSAIGGA